MAQKLKRCSFLFLLFFLVAAASGNVSAGLNRKSVVLRKGGMAFLSANSAYNVTKISSSDPSVAPVNRYGVVKGKKPGKAVITVLVRNKRYRCRVTVKKKLSESYIYKKLIAQKKKYPEGRKWTDSNSYKWNGWMFLSASGCAAFAFILSDAVFEATKAYIHHDISRIRVGDVLRINNDTHSVIVLKRSVAGVTVAEGNYYGKIHWGRVIPISELHKTLTYVISRY